MKLTTEWNNEAYDVVMERLHAEGFVAYAVGGCVRDAVMGLPFNDVDVATNARPHDLPKVFGVRQWDGDSDTRTNDEGVVLYPTGVRHGTWTVRVGDDTVEVTSFRKDVDTDGRNATVEYADTMEVDAERRDFTMNALYCDRNNDVHDPTGNGIADLLAGHVRFVGNAEDRVKEDYLRILRLFRFHARFGRGPMNSEAWSAASKWAFMIPAKVSGERVWDETKKLLGLHSPFEACAEMSATLVASKLFEKFDMSALGELMANERAHNCAPRWSRRYAALVGGEITFPCSNSDREEVGALQKALDGPMVGISQAVIAHRHGDVAAFDWALMRGARVNHKEITRGSEAVFPVTAQDLMDRGFTPGKALGDELRMLNTIWERSDLTQTREKLLNFSATVVRK